MLIFYASGELHVVFQAFRYRLYPTAEQETLLAKHFGCVRYVYNKALEIKKCAWEDRQESVCRKKLSAMLPVWKKDAETKWLSEVSAQSLQQSLVDLDQAYTRFFRDKKGYPKFKSKFGKQSFRVVQNISVGVDTVKIPVLAEIKAIIHRKPFSDARRITISKTSTGKYFASVLCETPEPIPEKMPVTEAGTVGIDLGLKHYAALSTGEKVENPKPLKKRLNTLRRRQRKFSRRKKGSKNKEKQRQVVARIHERVADTRKDFIHKLTTRLVRDNQTDSFAIEDLAVSNMVKNRHLARAISDAGWGEFRRQLEYKAERAGKNILVIGRFEPSSKMCSCGEKNSELKLSDRVWACRACGTTHDRDLNAARNIKRFALHPQNSVPAGCRESTPEEIAVR